MRLSRSRLLSANNGWVHLYWRAHNREYLLQNGNAKRLYFESVIFGLKHRGTGGNVTLRAFCFMDNHTHNQMGYQNGSRHLSHFMRVAHGRFGQMFNKANNRTGKVANERPKTSLIGDRESEIRAHFYIEANPIRAGITTLEKLRAFYWSSYRFYAYGEIDEVTRHISVPDWYLELGRTPKERQAAYQKLFKAYLEDELVPTKWVFRRFIGPMVWVEEQERRLKKELEALKELALGMRLRIEGAIESPPS